MSLTVKLRESAGFDLHDESEWLDGLLVAIEETESTFGPGLKWIIELDDDEPAENGDAHETWAFCSQKFSPRSKLYGWVKGIDPGAIPETGGTLDLEDFIGQRVQVMFERHQDVDDQSGEPIEKEKVVKIRAAKAAAKRERPTRAKAKDDEPEEDPY
jgi:hypothetical protein